MHFKAKFIIKTNIKVNKNQKIKNKLILNE